MFKKLFTLFTKAHIINEHSALYEHTIIGDRAHNEDAMGSAILPLGRFLIVCDGMGGHEAGDITAQALVTNFIDQIKKIKKLPTIDMLNILYQNAVKLMQTQVKTQHGDVDGHTTLACVWLDESQILTLHVGDSRIYHLNDKNVVWRTRDHSVVQILLDEGDISEEEMGTHEDQNKLFKSLSVLSTKIDKASIKQYPPLNAGESVLVCSDGFWENLTQQELVKLNNQLTQKQLEQACLKSQKCAKGKSDNITVQVFKQGRNF